LADRLTQFRAPRLVVARAQERVEIDGCLLGHFQLAEPDHRVQGRGGDRDPDLRSGQQADRIAKAIDDVADRIARRGGAPIGPNHVGTFVDAPDKQCLSKIAGLLRDAFPAREIDKAAESERRVHGKTRGSLAGGVDAALQQIVHEDTRLFQVVIEIVQAVVHGLRHDFLDSLSDRAQHFLIHRQHLAIGLLVRILERQRCVARGRGAGTHNDRQCDCDRPSAPDLSATHLLSRPFQFRAGRGLSSPIASAARTLSYRVYRTGVRQN